MNILKTAAATTVALGLAAIASAAAPAPSVIVNYVGSTAYRTFVTEAEYNVLSASGDTVYGASESAGAWTAAGSTYSNGKTHSAILGTMMIGGNPVVVEFRNYWTGSLAGCVDLAEGTADPFIKAADATTFTDVTSGGGIGDTNYENVAPNVAMSDCQYEDAQAVLANAPTPGPSYASTIGGSAFKDGGVTAGSHSTVGLVLFQWVVGNSAITPPFTNITTDAAQALIANGSCPLSMLTGNSSDVNNTVIFIGRNEDSGTRILYDANSVGGGLGLTQAFGPGTTQYMIQQSGTSTGYSNGFPTSNGSTIVVGSGVEGYKAWPKNWPLNTEPSMNWNAAGHSGYTGGGDVAHVLSCLNPVSASGFTGSAGSPLPGNIYIVSCLGTSDAETATAGGGTYLSYNGVTFASGSGASTTFNTSAIAVGQYTAWNYEHHYYLTSASNGNQAPLAAGSNARAAADAVADNIFGTTTANLLPVGMNIGDLQIVRNAGAGTIILQ